MLYSSGILTTRGSGGGLATTIYRGKYGDYQGICHTGILHLVANSTSLFNRVTNLFSSFLSRAITLDFPLIKRRFLSASAQVFTPTGYNLYIRIMI